MTATPPTRETRKRRAPIDLHRLSRPDMAAQLVADIIQGKAEEIRRSQEIAEQAVVHRTKRNRAWYFLFALPLLIGMTTWNLVRAATPPQVFSPSERESAVRFQMYLAAQALQAYHDSTGRWPADLKSVGMDDAGFVYEARNGDFTITDTTASVPLVFRRGDPLAPYAAGFQELKHASFGAGSL